MGEHNSYKDWEIWGASILHTWGMQKRPNGKGTKDIGHQSVGISASFPSSQGGGKAAFNDFPLAVGNFYKSWFVGSWIYLRAWSLTIGKHFCVRKLQCCPSMVVSTCSVNTQLSPVINKVHKVFEVSMAMKKEKFIFPVQKDRRAVWIAILAWTYRCATTCPWHKEQQSAG